MGKLFGTNGIRGVANIELTPEFIAKIGVAVGSYFNGGKIIAGSDGRLTSPMLLSAVISGLISAGCTVYNVGMAPTPTIQYTVKKNDVDGGVIITASHNPPKYNGIKVLGGDGVEIYRNEEDQIEKIFFEEKFRRAAWNETGECYGLRNIFDSYLEGVKSHLNIDLIKKAGFRVVVDPGNGVGTLCLPKLLQSLNCKVYMINAEIDGSFPSRPPEPRPENLNVLAETVKSLGADLGVALDGDGDRSIFVDEKGTIHWGDKTFALITKFFLKRNPQSIIVTPVSSSSLIKEIVETYNGKLVLTKVGSVEVSHKMKELKAELGGEENGGVFYGPHIPVRDGTMTTGLILNLMAEVKSTLSQLISELPYYYIMKDKVECPHNIKGVVIDEIAKEFEGLPTEKIDGVKAYFQDKSAILIRASGTEPAIRIYAEGKSREKVKKMVMQYKALLKNLIHKMKSDKN